MGRLTVLKQIAADLASQLSDENSRRQDPEVQHFLHS